MNNSNVNSGWSLSSLAQQTIQAARDVLVAREGGRVTTPFEVGMAAGASSAAPAPAIPAWFLPLVVVGGIFLILRKA